MGWMPTPERETVMACRYPPVFPARRADTPLIDMKSLLGSVGEAAGPQHDVVDVMRRGGGALRTGALLVDLDDPLR